jgi:hypothetical protein
MISSKTMVLDDDLLLAEGSSRVIYRHPNNCNWLIKVLKPEYIERKSGVKASWYKKLRPLGCFVGFERELREQLRIYLYYGYHPSCLYFIVGMQPTNLGLGQVVEVVCGRDGQLAPTLRTLIRRGHYDSLAEQALERFFDWLLESPITISDLTLDNLVYSYDESKGDFFCLIDGAGDPNLMPLKSILSYWNRLSKEKWVEKIYERILVQMKG